MLNLTCVLLLKFQLALYAFLPCLPTWHYIRPYLIPVVTFKMMASGGGTISRLPDVEVKRKFCSQTLMGAE